MLDHMLKVPGWSSAPWFTFCSDATVRHVDVNTTSIPKGMRINVTMAKDATVGRKIADRRPDHLDDKESEKSGSAPVRERLYPTITCPPSVWHQNRTT